MVWSGRSIVFNSQSYLRTVGLDWIYLRLRLAVLIIFDEARRKHPFHDDAEDNGVDNPKFLVEKRDKWEAGG